MGTDVVTKVEDELPGVRFSVDSHERLKSIGRITLRCEVNDVELFEACVVKLHGFKIFTGDLVEEVMNALGHELTNKQTELETKDAEVDQLRDALGSAQAEVARLRKLMQAVGMQLGIE